MNRFLSYPILLFIFLLLGCSSPSPSQPDEPLQILFIGNRYTFVNKMPGVFPELADLGDHRVNVITLAKSGYSLSDHAQDPETRTVIGGQKWDYIIFQEKSDIPIIDGGIDGQFYQGVQQINDLAAA
ncbi:MAG: hypothetical protein WBD62_20040, partial [Anaerolineales bacterium]